ncbi:MAG: hypothetical protein ABIJ23_01560 [Candidatus Magasanikbacteria bacterium]
MDISDKKFKKVQEKAEQEYKNINSVFCPFLKKDISFNAKGLEHIKFKGRNKARSREDQYIRLKCLPLANKILELSHTLQGHQERNEMVKEKSKRWSHKMKSVNYFEFVAVVGDVRVRVIIKKVEGGELHFWSIIPFWKMDIYGKRLIHSGNPGED